MRPSRPTLKRTCVLALLLAGAAPPPPPPSLGVKVVPLTGARRTDAVLPGRLVDAATPRGADGRRRVLVLITPDGSKAAPVPKGPCSLYLVDPERAGVPRLLADGLSAETDALAAADLDGDGAEEILYGEPGKLFTLGAPDAPTAPRLLLEASGFDLGRRDETSKAPLAFQAAEMGRLRTWKIEGGRLVPGPEHALPVRATRERQALLLSSPPVTPVPPLQVVGPEEHGKLRLRTILLAPDGQRTDAWARLPAPETIESFRYASLDGHPVLIVITTDAESIGVFAKQRFRLFLLTADRSRSGQLPALAVETESNRWYRVDPVVLDLDRDGRQDLVLIQPEGLGGGDLVVDTFFGQGNGRFERPRRLKLSNLDARSWSYGQDITGDGVADLVTVAKTGLRVFAGTTEPRRDLLDRRSRPAIDLGGVLGRPYVEDLDADGRPEVLVFSWNAREPGKFSVVRPGG